MVGYKVFEWRLRTKRWNSPYFNAPKHWDIRAGRTLKTYRVNRNKLKECGEGLHFYREPEYAKNLLDMWGLVIVYKGHTIKGASVIIPIQNGYSARTNSFRLDSVEGIYFRGEKVKRLPPKKIRGNLRKLNVFYGYGENDSFLNTRRM